MKLTCKWCSKTVELVSDDSDKLTVCIECLESIIKVIPKENNQCLVVTGLSGDRPLPKC